MKAIDRGRRYVACATSDLVPGSHLIVELGGRSVGVFNIDGDFYALHNRCPHKGAPLCLGVVTGTTSDSLEFPYQYERAGRILRCAWHGYEFAIDTGRALADPRLRAKTFRTSIEGEKVIVYI